MTKPRFEVGDDIEMINCLPPELGKIGKVVENLNYRKIIVHGFPLIDEVYVVECDGVMIAAYPYMLKLHSVKYYEQPNELFDIVSWDDLVWKPSDLKKNS